MYFFSQLFFFFFCHSLFLFSKISHVSAFSDSSRIHTLWTEYEHFCVWKPEPLGEWCYYSIHTARIVLNNGGGFFWRDIYLRSLIRKEMNTEVMYASVPMCYWKGWKANLAHNPTCSHKQRGMLWLTYSPKRSTVHHPTTLHILAQEGISPVDPMQSRNNLPHIVKNIFPP